MTREVRAWVAMGVGWILAVQQMGCVMPIDDGATTEVAERRAALKSADGERLFREIVFPNPESAKRSPALARLYEYSGLAAQSPEQLKATESVQALLVEGVAELDPEFFERFAKAVTSGDVLAVSRSMEEASLLLRESLQGWNEVLDEALRDEGLAKLHERLLKDERSQALRDLANLDREALRKLADLLREQLVPVPADTPARMPAIAAARQIDLSVALDRQIARQTILPPNRDVQLPIRAVDLAIQRQLQVPRAIDLAVHRQLQGPAKAMDFALTGDIAYVGDVTVDVETAIYAVVAVAVAVVAVVVAVFGMPVDDYAAYLNGKNTQLFRDQMIAEIAIGYAR